ncbi:GL19268 [Drosophila persimilis]|uniref:GL19268 n=1 Tax=Drosophila persimilis TaxID=7234 RepID=B4G8B2_DROPE|nr:GL19268 [Drosophila persimilis]
MSFHLRRKKGLDQTLAAKLTPEEYVKDTHAVPGLPELLDPAFPTRHVWTEYAPLRQCKGIRHLQALYVSHLHADHHIGLIGLLKERRQLAPKETRCSYLRRGRSSHGWSSNTDSSWRDS